MVKRVAPGKNSAEIDSVTNLKCVTQLNKPLNYKIQIFLSLAFICQFPKFNERNEVQKILQPEII